MDSSVISFKFAIKIKNPVKLRSIDLNYLDIFRNKQSFDDGNKSMRYSEVLNDLGSDDDDDHAIAVLVNAIRLYNTNSNALY